MPLFVSNSVGFRTKPRKPQAAISAQICLTAECRHFAGKNANSPRARVARTRFLKAQLSNKRQAGHRQVSRLSFGGGRGIRTPVGLPPNGFQELEIVSRFGAISSLNLPDFPEKKPFLRPFPDIPWKFARKMRENNQKHYGSNATE